MISDNPKLITVFGGSGFLGRYVILALARRGYRIRVATRNPNTAQHVMTLGNMGQVQPVAANIRNRASIERAMIGADHVINLVGIMHESGKQRFNALHVEGAGSIAEAAKAIGAGLTHISAMGADLASNSAYARTKAQGENAVRAILPDTVIIRPSIVFGPEDKFFNRFASMARISPCLPLIGGGQTKFQPVYVGDVAEVFARAVEGSLQPGATYELGGPQILSFRECLEEMLEVIDRKKLLISVPWSIARLKARFLGLLPNPLLTLDQVRLLENDNIVSQQAELSGYTLHGLGITGHSLQAILPTYLWSYRVAGQYTQPQE